MYFGKNRGSLTPTYKVCLHGILAISSFSYFNKTSLNYYIIKAIIYYLFVSKCVVYFIYVAFYLYSTF